METIIVEMVTSMAGSFGFCLLFHVRRQLLLPASLGGFFCWIIYLAAIHTIEGSFFPCLFASAFGSFYAEILARLLKAPATIFFLPAVVPLIPGGSLYYTMSYAVQNHWEQSQAYGSVTMRSALGIAVGASLIWAFTDMTRKLLLYRANSGNI